LHPYFQDSEAFEDLFSRAMVGFTEGCETYIDTYRKFMAGEGIFCWKTLKGFLRAQTGDITFKEVYDQNGWVLNITVSGMKLATDFKVLNYLTAPNVVVWSACLASCAVPGMYVPQELFMKDENGDVVRYHQGGAQHIQYQDGSVACDLPMQRIAELFNVNTFLVSQVNPHTVPFLWDTIGQDKVENFYSKRRMIMRLIQNEFKHVRNQLHTIGYAPAYMDHIYKIASLTSKGHVQIVPD